MSNICIVGSCLAINNYLCTFYDGIQMNDTRLFCDTGSTKQCILWSHKAMVLRQTILGKAIPFHKR